MKCIFLFICLFPSQLFSQSIRIREIKCKADPKHYNTADTTIIYPIVVSGNQAIDRSINETIKEQVLDPENSKMTTREAIRSKIRTGLIDLSYQVTFNKNGIVSIKFDVEAVGAYDNTWHIYLNFDSRTGKRLGTKDILKASMLEQFKLRVFADKIDSLKSYESEIKSDSLAKEHDTLVYQGAKDIVDSFCINNINIDNFSISEKGIEIIDDCAFPHVIRSIEPVYELKYSFEFMYPYLRSEFQRRLAN